MGKRLFRIYNDLRFREKMIVSFLLFGFIPLLFVSIFQLNSVIGVLQDEIEKTAATALDKMAQRVDSRLNMYNQVANALAYDAQLSEYLSQPYEQLGEAIDCYHYVWNKATNIVKNQPDIQYVTIYTANPDLVSTSPYLIHVDKMEDFEAYDKMKEAMLSPYIGGLRRVARHGNYWLDPSDAGIPVVSFNRVLLRQNVVLRSTGILTLGIRTDALYEQIESTSEHTLNFLVDAEGNVISATDSSWFGKQILSIVSDEAWEAALDGKAFVVDTETDQRLLLHSLQGGWTLGTLVSMKEVLYSSRHTRYMSVIAVLLGAVVSIILVNAVSAITARRVNLLLDKMRLPEQELPKPGAPIEGRDEIGMLDERFREMTSTLDDAIHELYQVEFEKREAQLLALQSRINPHFLYNTLSSIGWMTQTHTPLQVREAIETLAAYYRSLLSSGRDIITLTEELNGLSAYIALRQMRGGGRIRAVISVDPMIGEVLLPKMTLQPIVENCIEHGISTEHPSVSILISSSLEGGDVLIHISDDGAGIDDDTLARVTAGSLRPSGGGYGIHNVQMRLKLHFGEKYALHIENQKEGGVCVTVRIPLEGASAE
jgi:Predicted signal transduction protein with a C-terminal ATPase domain